MWRDFLQLYLHFLFLGTAIHSFSSIANTSCGTETDFDTADKAGSSQSAITLLLNSEGGITSLYLLFCFELGKGDRTY
ncbi:hypothetical protein PL11201_680215 [Planktothrix sp. PCC 11201]|nr:hypothetical protein PL11201_680215 [Planktothrix sp. PCC 11201]